MQSSSFDVQVIGNEAELFVRDGYRYVSLLPNSTYSLRLYNNSETRCDVEVTIDGTYVGVWRIGAHSSITIDRPEGVNRTFTFVGETSSIARRTGAVAGAESNGLISAVFKPAKHVRRSPSPVRLTSAMAPSSMAPSSSLRRGTNESSSYDSGVTVLGRRSSQEFSQVPSLDRNDIDWNRVTEVNIRLVVRSRETYIPLSRGIPPRINSYNNRRVD